MNYVNELLKISLKMWIQTLEKGLKLSLCPVHDKQLVNTWIDNRLTILKDFFVLL